MKYALLPRSVAALITVTALTALTAWTTTTLSSAAPPSAKSAPEAPQKQVKTFLRYHVSHEFGLTAKTLEARRRWLAPSLYRLLQRELARQKVYEAKHPGEAPFIDGDVFVAAQELPTGIQAAPAPIRNGVCAVPVTLRFGPGSRRVIYRMRLTATPPPARWLIEDVISEGESLVKTLSRPVYDTLPTPAPKKRD